MIVRSFSACPAFVSFMSYCRFSSERFVLSWFDLKSLAEAECGSPRTLFRPNVSIFRPDGARVNSFCIIIIVLLLLLCCISSYYYLLLLKGLYGPYKTAIPTLSI